MTMLIVMSNLIFYLSVLETHKIELKYDAF